MTAEDKLTDEKLKEMEKHLREIYDRADKEVGKAWTEYMEKANADVSRLTDAYIKAKESGDKDAIREAGKALAGAKQERTIYNNHYQQLTRDLAENISHVNETAVAYINNQLPEIYSLNYNSVAKSVNKELGGMVGGTSFDLVDQNTVKRLATRKENLLPLKEVNGKKDIRWNVAKINSEVTQGILQGEAMPKIAKRLSNVMGMDKVSAIRNARTTVTSAQNKGRMDMMKHARSKGVIAQKGWSAARDDRVRHSHMMLDGEFVNEDEPFSNGCMYPGDPNGEPEEVYNCRCSLIYKIVGFGDPQEEEDDPWDGLEDEKKDEATIAQSEFTPAKTKAEATEYAQRFAEDVNYTGISLENANIINERLTTLTEKYPIEKLNAITNKSNGVMSANYSHLNINGKKLGSVLNDENLNFELNRAMSKSMLRDYKSKYPNVMPDAIKRRVEKLESDLKFTRWGVHSSYENHVAAVVTHEYGHILSDQYFGMINGSRANPNIDLNWSIKGVTKEWEDAFFTARSNGDIYSLSQYGNTNAREFFAESFLAREMGEKLPDYVEKLMEETLKNGIMR